MRSFINRLFVLLLHCFIIVTSGEVIYLMCGLKEKIKYKLYSFNYFFTKYKKYHEEKYIFLSLSIAKIDLYMLKNVINVKANFFRCCIINLFFVKLLKSLTMLEMLIFL